MGLKDFIRTLKPTVEEESCEYLLSRVLDHLNKNRTYRLTNVTPGLAALIKRKREGEYFRSSETFLLNPRANTNPQDLSCNMQDLTQLLIKLKKGE